jgi:hypothetical protein
VEKLVTIKKFVSETYHFKNKVVTFSIDNIVLSHLPNKYDRVFALVELDPQFIDSSRGIINKIIPLRKDELKIMYTRSRRRKAHQMTENSSKNNNENEISYIKLKEEDYNYFMERDKKLSALEAGGVDSWSGYDFAMSVYEDNK